MRSNHPRHVEIRLAVPADAAARREALRMKQDIMQHVEKITL